MSREPSGEGLGAPPPRPPESPRSCPSCQGEVRVTTLTCAGCGTRIEGRFSLCRFCQLDDPTRALLEGFLRARGNIRELQKELGVSYPTARARLDQLWEQLGYQKSDGVPTETAEDIVAQLKAGEIDVEEAESRLRQRRSGSDRS
ncbi:MAG: DUF2089 domain-containing protein [Candidatus Eisenbacteria bacterium]